MRAVLLVVVLFTTLVAADFRFTGSFNSDTNAQWFEPSGDPTSCSSSSQYYFQSINTTFATAGVREIQGYSSSSADLFVYRGFFNVSNSCQNLVYFPHLETRAYYNYADSAVLTFHTANYFEADNYFFVVSSSSSGSGTTSYPYGVNIYDAVYTVQVNDSGPQWQQPYVDSSKNLAFNGNASYAAYSFTAASSGRFEVGAFSVNVTDTSAYGRTFLGIYNGIITDPNYIYENYTGAYIGYPNSYALGRFRYYFQLVQGQNYTVIASDTNHQNTTFGFIIRPTDASRFTPGSSITKVFTQPEKNSDGSCTASSSNVALPYSARVQTVIGNVYVGKASDSSTYNQYTDEEITGFDFVTFLYRGSNANPPTACPFTASFIGYTDSSEVSDRSIFSGNTYTSVVSPYSTSVSVPDTAGLLFFSFIGQTVGASTTSGTTTAATSTAATTAGATTTAATTTAATTATTAATTATTAAITTAATSSTATTAGATTTAATTSTATTAKVTTVTTGSSSITSTTAKVSTTTSTTAKVSTTGTVSTSGKTSNAHTTVASALLVVVLTAFALVY